MPTRDASETATPAPADVRPGPAREAAPDAGAPPPVSALGGEGFPPILTTAQAAELLQVHVEYLRRMVREDRIPAHRFPGGREIRFVRDELVEWVRTQPGHDRSPSRDTDRA